MIPAIHTPCPDDSRLDEIEGEATVAAMNREPIDIDRFVREWQEAEPLRVEHARITHEFFDDIRDRKCAEMWGCTVAELPWHAGRVL